jgi:hypothetical protein
MPADAAERAEWLSRQWTATLNPTPTAGTAATKSYLDTLFVSDLPVGTRWGFKDVHISAGELRVLTSLYPDSVTLLLDRDPLDAFTSYVRKSRAFGRGLFQPGVGEVTTARQFGELWVTRMRGFISMASSGRLLVLPYEHMLEGPQTVAASVLPFCGIGSGQTAMESFIGALARKVKGAPKAGHGLMPTERDLEVLRQICGQGDDVAHLRSELHNRHRGEGPT